MFGLSKEESERGLNDLYRRVVSYVSTDLLKPFSDKDQALDERITTLERKLMQATQENTRLSGTVERLSGQLDGYERRLSEMERDRQKTGIILEAVKPKGGITFEEVKSLAREVSDTAYQRIRDYLLLEMTKKGYEKENPDFIVYDRDSNSVVRLICTDEDMKPKAGFNQVQKSGVPIENIPKFSLEKAPNDGRTVLFSEKGNGNDYFQLGVDGSKEDYWAEKLREDLPTLLQSYMLGYSLRCLEENRFNAALSVQQTHDLKDNSALLVRMSEVMQRDPNLADKFLTYYSSARE